ncbi:MAG: hypothetical protein CM1200mP28_05550 [Deltaproteobacteria bacterium]|nr:MAG: hypothetical protein CM1200mP28_05550 [Deltaproteobacteria bacterium]
MIGNSMRSDIVPVVQIGGHAVQYLTIPPGIMNKNIHILIQKLYTIKTYRFAPWAD